MTRAALVVATTLAVAGCAVWPGTTPAGAAQVAPELPDPGAVGALPLDPELLVDAPLIRHLDGRWIVDGGGLSVAIYRRAIPGDTEPVLVAVTDRPFVEDHRDDCAAVAYSLVRLAPRDGAWVRGPAGPERYVTAP